MSDDIIPFRIDVPDADLDDLRQRLRQYPVAGARDRGRLVPGHPPGLHPPALRLLAGRYDWRASEARLNRFPQFLTRIDGVDIHFIHARSPHPGALPLVITHGWPGSIVEFHKVIEPLADPVAFGGDAADAFHVVCPSLPGYGFSGKPGRPGWGTGRIADAWDQLMARLGYPRYAAQGGDWGAQVTTALGMRHPEHLAGIHLNMPIAFPDPADGPADRAGAGGPGHDRPLRRAGFGLLQGAVDPPADRRLRPGRLAGRAVRLDRGEVLVLDRLRRRPGQRPVPRRDARQRDVLLAARAPGPPRPGSTGRTAPPAFLGPVTVPVGCSIFPKEIFRPSRRWAEKQFRNLHYWNELDKGGHFAAFEQPQTFVNEVRACFRSVR